ncbi:DUF4112 domain-containing protein [Marivita hallyeonensis]|uniref:DUF4112 domain-containing protein n=1 Tax=Marivita hallyeonensis TaxID=996342 RepID=A0A1M5VST1_9RHOB|nr:DUF4112 domain-containing protein [Marivita hallyeonensis]SHH78044.1 protein of unknown function [Marivita hallyeonensis]
MPAPLTASEKDRRLARMQTLARRLDSQFRIPGTRIRFGWDSVLGLVPGLGDLITVGPAALMIVEAYRLGVRKRTLIRMGANAAADFVLGGVPVIGDAFDLFFKANRRNLALVEADLGRHAPLTAEEKKYA